MSQESFIRLGDQSGFSRIGSQFDIEGGMRDVSRSFSLQRGSRSLVRVVSRDRDASRSRPRRDASASVEWGGDLLVPNLGGGFAIREDRVLSLPAATPRALEDRFSSMFGQTHFGPADVYAKAVANDCLTSSCFDGAWIFNDYTNLWRKTPVDEWINEIAKWLAAEMMAIALDVQRTAEPWMEYEKTNPPTPEYNTKMAYLKAVQKALNAINKLDRTSLKHIVAIARTKLINEAAVENLDALRDCLPFRNGVVSLRTGEKRDVTRADFLTYTLSYDYDDSVDTQRIVSFMRSLMPDDEAYMRLHAVIGYWSTGETSLKRYDQLYADPGAGKTTMLEIVTNALESFASMNKVPAEEMGKQSNFENGIHAALTASPRPRLIALDETDGDKKLAVRIMNNVTSGKRDIVLSCRLKGKTADPVPVHAKWVFASNQVMSVDASATGTLVRRDGAPFSTVFVPAESYNELTSPKHHKPVLSHLVDYLQSHEGKQEVIRWIIQGAIQFYNSGLPKSEAWAAQTFMLNSHGDPYVLWLSEHYIPTGNPLDRIAEDVLIHKFRDDNRHCASQDTRKAIRAALHLARDFVFLEKWANPAPYYNCAEPIPGSGHPMEEVIGYTCLRQRKHGDLPWGEAMVAAKAIISAARVCHT